MSRQVGYERWSTPEVCCWLRTSGLADLADEFSAKGVQGSDLNRLDDIFLQSRLGITDAERRSSLLAAVQVLTGRPIGKRSPPKPNDAPALPPPMRRFVTLPSGIGAGSENGPPQAQHTSHPNPANLPPRRSSTQASLLPTGYPVEKISAQDLLTSGASFSGWIRKQGGSVRTWKRRYMILKGGCVYYFKTEMAPIAQGQFSLKDYQAIQVTESTKYPWCVKLVNKDKTKRTYFISSSSQPEMNIFLEKIQEDIRIYCSDSGDIPPPVVPRPISTLPGHSNRPPQPQVSVPLQEYDRDDDDSDEEDQPVSASLNALRVGGRSNQFRSSLPPRLPSTSQHNPRSFQRSEPPPLPEAVVQADANAADVDADYLQLVEGSAAPPTAPRSVSPHSHSPQPPRAQPTSSFQPVSLANLSVPPRDSQSSPNAPGRPRMNYEITSLNSKMSQNGQGGSQESDEDDDYISPEVYTSDLDFEPEDMDRETAEMLLKQYGRNGFYILRSGSTTQLSVLTVLTGDRCRHYKVFYDPEHKFSLHRGQYFDSVPDLLEYYHSTTLPKCEYRLAERYRRR